MLLGFVDFLAVRNNELAGRVPSDFGKLIALDTIDIGLNFLKGTLPDELQALTNLKTFKANGNALDGPIFETVALSWTKLAYLYLEDTHFTGTIPSAALELWSDTMVEFNLGKNKIRGTLPQALGRLRTLIKLVILGPDLEGEIPNFTDLVRLGRLFVVNFFIAFNTNSR